MTQTPHAMAVRVSFAITAHLPMLLGLRKRFLGNLLATIAFAMLTYSSRAQAPSDRLQQVVKPYVGARVFMGSVLVAKNGKVVFKQELRHGGFVMESPKFSHDSIQCCFD